MLRIMVSLVRLSSVQLKRHLKIHLHGTSAKFSDFLTSSLVFDRNWHIIRQKELVSAEKNLPKLTPMLFRLEHSAFHCHKSWQLILFLSSAFWGHMEAPQAEVPSYLVTLDRVALVRAEGDVDEGLPP